VRNCRNCPNAFTTDQEAKIHEMRTGHVVETKRTNLYPLTAIEAGEILSNMEGGDLHETEKSK